MSLPEPIATAGRAQELLSAAGRRLIASFLSSVRDPAGGFRDRAGNPDLYYTVFGIGGLMALGVPLFDGSATQAFLARYSDWDNLSFVNLVSLIRCYRCLELGAAPALNHATAARRRKLTAALDRYRSADGGFSHEGQLAGQGTLYAAFLAEQAYGDLDQPLPGVQEMLRSVASLKTPDGGYANHPRAGHGSTPATASAAILLARYGHAQASHAALTCIDTLYAPEGGYRASPVTPGADLLSTATAVYAQSACGRPVAEALRPVIAAFVETLWHDAGGFCGHPADPLADVEYTFYALLSLGSIAATNAS